MVDRHRKWSNSANHGNPRARNTEEIPGSPAHTGSSPSRRILDVPAGPPTQPAHDWAAHRDLIVQQGLADGPIYDQYSFVDRVPLLYLRVIRDDIAARFARSHRAEEDDLNVADLFTRQARAAKAEADQRALRTDQRRAEARERRAREERVLLGDDPEGAAWRAPDRLDESSRSTRLASLGVPLVGLAIETPWSFFALRVLGESNLATVTMAVVFGWAGVLLAHLSGVLVRYARAGARRSRLAAAIACGACLGVVALFLAAVRTAALAAPVVTATGQTLPSGLTAFNLDRNLVFAGWLAVNLGLWLTVAVLAYLRHNPHVVAHQRARAKEDSAEFAHVGAVANAKDAEQAVANSESAKEASREMWKAYRAELTAFGRELEDLYQHSLAFGKASPEFTTALELHRDAEVGEPNTRLTRLRLTEPPEADETDGTGTEAQATA